MKGLWGVVLVAACHREVKTALIANQVTDQAVTENVLSQDSTKSREQTYFHQVIEPVVGEVDVTVDIEATPTKPARHYKFHSTKTGGETVTDSGAKTVEVTKAQTDTAKKAETEIKTDIKSKTETVTDAGPGWKFYLTIALIAALLIGGVLVVLKFKLWRPL